MKSKIVKWIFLIETIILWILVNIPVIYVLRHCFETAANGTYHGIADGQKIYGVQAFVDTLFLYLAFFFPIAALWFVFLIFTIAVTVLTVRKWKKKEIIKPAYEFDPAKEKPIIRASICNGEQVAGFKNIETGEFHEIALIRNPKELEDFKTLYGLDHVDKEY